MDLKIKRVRSNSDLCLPSYQTSLSAGMDLRADVSEPVILKPGQRSLVPTGIAIELPENCEAQVRPRSGLALKKGIAMVNAPGTIDADYRGEIGVILINLGHEDFVVNRGERIAQLVVCPVTRVQIKEVQELSDTTRGAGGFGSTGT